MDCGITLLSNDEVLSISYSSPEKVELVILGDDKPSRFLDELGLRGFLSALIVPVFFCPKENSFGTVTSFFQLAPYTTL